MTRPVPTPVCYQSQHCQLTLRQALAAYYAANPQLCRPDRASTPEMRSFIANHDASHVVFGTDSHYRGEILQDVLTLLAMAVNWPRYLKAFVRGKETKSILRGVPVWGTLRELPWLCSVLPRVLWRSIQMPKKWPWEGWQRHLDQPLGEIRREYGIQVL